MIDGSETGHEIAGHSFSHARFGELDRNTAAAEIDEMCEVFDSHGVELSSFIHPYISIDHCDILAEHGFTAYSLGVEESAETIKSGLFPFLTGNTRFWGAPPVTPDNDRHGLTVIPRSRQLSDERWGFLNPRRIRNTIDRGGDGVVHLTAHPHNLLYDPHLKRTFPRIVEEISRRRDAGEISVATFRELASQFR